MNDFLKAAEEFKRKNAAQTNGSGAHSEEPPLREPEEMGIVLAEKKPVRPSYGQSTGSYLPDHHRMLPHSSDAEQGVLCSILISPHDVIPLCVKAITEKHFHIPAHAAIYTVLVEHWREGMPLDFITLTQTLNDSKQLDQCGGPMFIANLFTFVPTAANVEYYLEIVQEKFKARAIITACSEAVAKAYDNQDEISEALVTVKSTLSLIEAGSTHEIENFEFEALTNFDSNNDPDNLLGNRWICRGHTSLIVGGAGFGKSTFDLQAAIYWGHGLPLFGIRPVRPLKSLIIQAENDLGDAAEQFQGVMAGIMEMAKDFNSYEPKQIASMIEKNLVIKRIVSATGEKFCDLLDSLCGQIKPDLLHIDPMFAFAGFDLVDQAAVSKFLREMLMPLAVKHRMAIIMIHHTGKPDKDSAAKSKWTEIDFQYLGFGSSEIQNAFRSVSVILPVSGAKNTFRLVLSKRGSRAGALSLDEDCTYCEGHKKRGGVDCPRCNGTGRNRTTSIYIAHAEKGIHWMQVPKPEGDDGEQAGKATRFQTKHTIQEILEVMSLVEAKTTTELRKELDTEKGMSKTTFFRLWEHLKEEGKICVKGEGWVKK